MTQHYTVKDLADALGVSVGSIRAYRQSGKIPPPLPITSNGHMLWDQDAYDTITRDRQQPAGTYPIAPRIQARNHRPHQIQFRGQHIMHPLKERTLPGENVSATVRWIVEQYLELMATLDADWLTMTPDDILDALLKVYWGDEARRKEAQS